jgi:hypothetical protein
MATISFVDLLREPVPDTGQSLLDHSKLPPRLHIAMMLAVRKWKISGKFYARRLISPAPAEAPFQEIISSELETEMALNFELAATDDSAVAALIEGEGIVAEWRSNDEDQTGTIFLRANTLGGVRSPVIDSGDEDAPFCFFGLVATYVDSEFTSQGTQVVVNGRESGTIKIKAFGKEIMANANLGAEPGFEDEPDIPPAENVILEAVEYREFGGLFDPETGVPV